MQNPAIHRVRIDIVSPVDREVTVEIGDDLAFGVAKCAADVNMGRGVGGDEASVISSPRSGDFCDWSSRRARAGKRDGGCQNASELHDTHPRHA